jgi:hypothetical protein
MAKDQGASAKKHSSDELTDKAAPNLTRHATAAQNQEENSNIYSTAPAHRAGQNLQNAAFSIKTKLQPIQNNEPGELATTGSSSGVLALVPTMQIMRCPKRGFQPSGNHPPEKNGGCRSPGGWKSRRALGCHSGQKQHCETSKTGHKSPD